MRKCVVYQKAKKPKGADQPGGPCRLINSFTVHYVDSIVCLLANYELSRLYSSSIKVNPQDTFSMSYRKVPKFSDARKLCCKLPKIQEKRPKLWVFRQKDANGIANRSSLIWVCTVCPDQFV